MAVDEQESTKEPALTLREWSWQKEYGYAKAQGLVTNNTSQSLKNVVAVVYFFTKDKKFITTGEALIEYNPVLPGQTSPFEVLAPANPEMDGASVQFKSMFGGTISHQLAGEAPTGKN